MPNEPKTQQKDVSKSGGRTESAFPSQKLRQLMRTTCQRGFKLGMGGSRDDERFKRAKRERIG